MRRIALFVISFAVWFLLSWPFDRATGALELQMFIAGGVLALVVTLLFVRFFTETPAKLFSPVRYFWIL